MNNWLRPSIQQPRIISNAVKQLFAPVLFVLNIQQAFWTTWHQVYRNWDDTQ